MFDRTHAQGIKDFLVADWSNFILSFGEYYIQINSSSCLITCENHYIESKRIVWFCILPINVSEFLG